MAQPPCPHLRDAGESDGALARDNFADGWVRPEVGKGRGYERKWNGFHTPPRKLLPYKILENFR